MVLTFWTVLRVSLGQQKPRVPSEKGTAKWSWPLGMADLPHALLVLSLGKVELGKEYTAGFGQCGSAYAVDGL